MNNFFATAHIMVKSAGDMHQMTLAECMAIMTLGGFFAWLAQRPPDLLVVFLPPALIYFAGEVWWARRGEWSFGGSIKTAIVSTILAAPLTGVAGALHGSNEGIASTGLAAFLGGTFLAAIFGLMPSFTALVIYVVGRDVFPRMRSARIKVSEDLSNSIIKVRPKPDMVKMGSDADDAPNR